MARDKDSDEGGYTTPEAEAESAGFKRSEDERDKRKPKDKAWPPKNIETKVPKMDGSK